MGEEVKVVKIKNLFHARYFVGGVVKSEYTCKEKNEIGLMCREMLRWQNKLGNDTPFTRAAREKASEKGETVTGTSVRKVL